METKGEVCLNLKSCSSLTFARKDVQVCGYSFTVPFSANLISPGCIILVYDDTWGLTSWRVSTICSFIHLIWSSYSVPFSSALFTCDYHGSVCGRRMGWCLQQKWVVPLAEATPSSHDLLKAYHSACIVCVNAFHHNLLYRHPLHPLLSTTVVCAWAWP